MLNILIVIIHSSNTNDPFKWNYANFWNGIYISNKCRKSLNNSIILFSIMKFNLKLHPFDNWIKKLETSIELSTQQKSSVSFSVCVLATLNEKATLWSEQN